MTDTSQIGAFGFAFALTVYALLTMLLLSGWRRRDQSLIPALATGVSVLWAGVWVAGLLDLTRTLAIVIIAEWARGLAWLIALIVILQESGRRYPLGILRSSYGIFVGLVAIIPVVFLLLRAGEPPMPLAWIGGGYVLSVLAVLATEQLYRNAPAEWRSSVNYLCVAVAGIFLFDLLLYGSAIAGLVAGPEYWAARGYVNVLFAVPLTLGIWRRSRISTEGQTPRQMVFYTFGITIIAAYVVLIIIGKHYVQNFGGSWSAVGGIVLIVAAIAAALTILASASTRARVRVLLMKTFFQYKYDYRNEWLRFIATLSESGLENVAATAVRAVAQIVNSPGGVVWIRERGSDDYVPAGAWQSEIPDIAPVENASALIQFLKNRQWVIDLEEMKRYPARYEELQLEKWLTEGNNWWLIVPVFLGRRLYGFVLLQRPRTVPALNFEDHDLLRTVGRHVGMHINQAEADKRLAESRQFGTYNRLTAFLMHDLNNLIAQQSLVVKNAERHRQNPQFVDDAIETIANSVSRMKRLMAQLSSGSKTPATSLTDVREALTKAVNRCQALQPTPRLEIEQQPIMLQADPERLTTVFEHLIRNAQDATAANGNVVIEAGAANGTVNVSIKDTGHGMNPEFIRERLFRPFDSTKGSESMGIGAYQARDYVRSLGGQLEVSSRPGIGTTFYVRLPLGE